MVPSDRLRELQMRSFHLFVWFLPWKSQPRGAGTEYAGSQPRLRQQALLDGLLHLFPPSSSAREGLQTSPLSRGPRLPWSFIQYLSEQDPSDVWHQTSACSQFVFLSPPFACNSPPRVFDTVYSSHRTNRICQTILCGLVCSSEGLISSLLGWSR